MSRKTRSLLTAILAIFGTVSSYAAETAAPALPTVEVLATDPTALEGASSGAFTLIRSGSITADLAVNYTLSGSASNGVDYVLVKTSTKIAAGFLAADIVITPIAHPKDAGNKKVVLTLDTNANYAIHGHKSASVTIVNDTFNNQAPTVSLVAPTNGSAYAYPAAITFRAEAADADDAIAKVSFYANDDFLGQSTNSPYTLVWTNARPGKYALFARATDVLEKSALSSAVHITVTNVTPVITLLTPTNGATFGVKSNIKLEADASAKDGMAKVQFFGDNRFLGSVTNKPYTLVWSNVPPGKHTVSAKAIDLLGSSASASAKITVTNAPPVVSITSPAEAAGFTAHSNITIKADATDSDDKIARVSFYANSRFLGRVTTSPYTLTWTNATPGDYKLSAIATDEFGSATISKSVKITVSK